MNDIVLAILAIIILLMLDLLCIAMRTSYLEVNLARLLGLREQNETAVNQTLLLIQNLNWVKTSLSVLLLLLRFGLAGLFMLIFSVLMPQAPIWLLGVLLALAAIVVFFLEWLVDSMVSKSPETWAVRLNSPVQIITAPFSIALRSFGHEEQALDMDEIPTSVTEDELKTLVDAGEEEGVFEHVERQMIHSIFQLGETLAREIMVPRIDMLALDSETPLFEAVDVLLNSGHSRVPVYKESVDNTLGLLYAKDLLEVWRNGGELESLEILLRPANFVPEAKKADELLAEMQKQRIHMAIVVDEYGGVAGLVTLEDIVEEIFGEIQDEYDDAEESPYQLLDNDEYIFQGRIDLDDFNDIMECEFPTDEADTLGGFIYSNLGHVPNVGETVEQDGVLLTVEQVSSRRIRKIRARKNVIEPEAKIGRFRENR
jgi:CBS domain containing-hemolysin-like protein